MSQSIESSASVNGTQPVPDAKDHAEHVQAQEQAQDAQDTEGTETPESDADEALADAKRCMRHLVDAFRRGVKAFALSRVESGYWARAYVLNRRASGMSRDGSVQLVKAALAVEAESVSDADPNTLMHIYGLVAWFTGRERPFGKGNTPKKGEPDWTTLGFSKLVALMGFVVRDGETENWILRPGLSETDVRAAITWAIGDETARPNRKDIEAKVLSIVNPEKAAEKAAQSGTGTSAAPAADEKPATVEGDDTDDADDTDDTEEPAQTATESVQSNLLKVAEAANPRDLGDMMAEMLSNSQDATATMRQFALGADWDAEMAAAVAHSMAEKHPKAFRSLALAVRNLEKKYFQGGSKDGAEEKNGATAGA